MKKPILFVPILIMLFAFKLNAQTAGYVKTKLQVKENSFTLPFRSWCAEHPYSLLVYFSDTIRNNPQADMILKGIENYFTRGFSFSQNGPVKQIPTAIITSKKEFESDRFEDCRVFTDSAHQLGYYGFRYRDFGKITTATVILINQNMEQLFISNNYRGVGEQLRPMESQIRMLLGDTVGIKIPYTEVKQLKTGEIAPDFYIKDNVKLSDMRGKKNVILSFYPAPFTGSVHRFELVPENNSKKTVSSNTPRKLYGGCGGQALYLENLVFNAATERNTDSSYGDTNTMIVYVSASSAPILYNWEKYLGTKNIIYANDPDYYIARNYSSYSYQFNYDLRSLFIINKEGEIVYVNYNLGNNLPPKKELEKYLTE